MNHRILFFLPFLCLFVSNLSFAQHTFSIVAVDPATGEIGSAGATCISDEHGAQDISDIVLGVGAIHTQSYWDPINQVNARNRMIAGDSPEEIIDWLLANDVSNDPSARQYNIVDLNNGTPRSAAFTGTNCFAEYIHLTGPNYSIAGNILISEDVVKDMETAFVNTNGSLADKLMAALQGAKRPGADSRCLNLGISSASAFIRVADPSDTDPSYGNLSLDLNVWISDLTFEPINALQSTYNAIVLDTKNPSELSAVSIFPNPAKEVVTIKSDGVMMTAYEITNISGKVISKRKVGNPTNHIYLDVMAYAPGVYTVKLFEDGKEITTKKLLVAR